VLKQHVETVDEYLAAIADRVKTHPRVLELGAGTGTASLLLRKRIPGARIVCSDISLPRMQTLMPRMAELVGVSCDDIDLVENDFSYPLPFEDDSFDIILFDGALHHSRNIWTTLEECRRIVAPNGAVAAIREQYLAPLTFNFAIDRLLNTPEVKAGVAENAYLRKQYEYYFRAAGFDPTFYRVSPGKWKFLAPFNGIAFSKWSIWATISNHGSSGHQS
jgi:ubiquinone/menaquinone biosynthesis C-methylase UbiE